MMYQTEDGSNATRSIFAFAKKKEHEEDKVGQRQRQSRRLVRKNPFCFNIDTTSFNGISNTMHV